MKIVFDHKFGAQEHVDLNYYSATLIDVDESELDDILALGWLTDINDDGEYYWYQTRSTRCNLKNFNSETDLLNVTDQLYQSDNDKLYYDFDADLSINEMDEIYNKYCKHKKYSDLFHSEVSTWLECDYKMVYYNSKNPIAWSKLRLYTEHALETVLFVWDYKNPKLRVGIRSLVKELKWAKDNDFKYVYLGPGYEKGSIYKANIDGFEWWTGSEWSTDTTEYIRLCERDSKTHTIKQLSEF